MSTISGNPVNRPNGARSRDRRATDVRVTHPRVLASEWIKLRSLRSTLWAVTAIAAAIIGGGAFAAVGIVVQDTPPADKAVALDPSGGTLSGVGLAQLAVIAFGVLAVTTEYRNRAIRTSLTVVPARLTLVLSKAVVLAVVTTVVSLLSLALTFVVADAVIGIDGASISWTTQGVARALVGAGLTLAVIAVLASGFGWLLRSTAGAVSVMLAVFYILPSLAVFLPTPVAAYLPSNAAGAITQVQPASGSLSPWVGLAVLGCYTLLALAAAAFIFRRRDA